MLAVETRDLGRSYERRRDPSYATKPAGRARLPKPTNLFLGVSGRGRHCAARSSHGDSRARRERGLYRNAGRCDGH